MLLKFNFKIKNLTVANVSSTKLEKHTIIHKNKANIKHY